MQIIYSILLLYSFFVLSSVLLAVPAYAESTLHSQHLHLHMNNRAFFPVCWYSHLSHHLSGLGWQHDLTICSCSGADATPTRFYTSLTKIPCSWELSRCLRANANAGWVIYAPIASAPQSFLYLRCGPRLYPQTPTSATRHWRTPIRVIIRHVVHWRYCRSFSALNTTVTVHSAGGIHADGQSCISLCNRNTVNRAPMYFNMLLIIPSVTCLFIVQAFRGRL